MNFNPDRSQYDHRTFYGRLRHFAGITNPFIAFTPTSELMRAKCLMDKCRIEGALPASLPELHRAQRLFHSAFHPDTGELQNFAGRMCFNVWGGTDLLTAYTTAVGGALAVALGLKQYFVKRNVNNLIQRMVPLIAVAVANAINIPLMRQK
ncbi:tricarboxylate carrier [Dictyocaulus viviparus]|uniref:Tricarboxylate carrier n=1 Tax=Dictyocaulus viviparus TaxID=29172 RepID=A0A0D8XPI2_DICVI|nr:tricarboxylate carrier [Dictyocaulus viviparus]